MDSESSEEHDDASLEAESLVPHDKHEESKMTKALSYICKLRHLICLVALGICQHIVGPSVPYIVNSFFAEAHGGDDCEQHPKSTPCRRGAAEAAFFHGWTDAVGNIVAMVLAVGLGSYSDSIGRRPLVRTFGVLTILPLVALALHMFAGLTLWVFLALEPAVMAFDVNGVFLALMSDAIEEPEDRAAAFGTLIAVFMLVMGIVMPFGFLLPQQWALLASLAAGGLKLVYLFALFPETSRQQSPSEELVPPNNPLATLRIALKVLTRNSFIATLAITLVISGLGSAGYAIVMPPVMTGYLGFRRVDKLALASAAAVSVLFAFGVVLGPVVERFGQVRVLQFSIAASASCPFLIACCREQWHLILLAAVLAGPVVMAIPLVSALKSNLVAPDEQGLVQGAIASLGKGAATLGFLVFSFVFKVETDDGKVKSLGAAMPSFMVIAAFSLASLALAATLPLQPPPPPQPNSSSVAMDGLELASWTPVKEPAGAGHLHA